MVILFIKYNLKNLLLFFDGVGGWGMGDGGLGIGDWAQSPIPNPQSPIPNPHSNQMNYKKYEIINK